MRYIFVFMSLVVASSAWGQDYIRLFVKEAGSVFFCRETCEETLKEFEVEEKASGEVCQKVCDNGFRDIYHEILAVEGEAARDEKQEICEDIYRRSDAKTACQNLPYSLVQSIEEIYEIIEDNVDIQELKQLDPIAFSDYVYISLSPLKKQIGYFSRKDLKQFLAWLAGSPFNKKAPDLVNPIFSLDQKDQKFSILREFLRNIQFTHERAERRPLTDALNTNIKNQYDFFDIITWPANENAPAGQWVHNFIEKKECKESDNEKLCALQTYCSLSGGMSYETAKNLMKLPYFKDFVNNIITLGINRSNWSRQNFQSHEELDLWHNDLCQ